MAKDNEVISEVINYREFELFGVLRIVICYKGGIQFDNIEIYNEKSLNTFIVNNKQSVLSCITINKGDFTVKCNYPTELWEKKESFNKIFTQEMLKFSTKYGMQKLALMSIIALQTKDLTKLRIFTINEANDEMVDNFERDIDNLTYLNIPTINAQHILICNKINSCGNNLCVFDSKEASSKSTEFLRNAFNSEFVEKNPLCVLVNQKDGIQGRMSCFLMCLSYLRLIETNENFKKNLRKYFESGVGQLMVVEGVFNLINPNNQFLKIKFKDECGCCCIGSNIEINEKIIQIKYNNNKCNKYLRLTNTKKRYIFIN